MGKSLVYSCTNLILLPYTHRWNFDDIFSTQPGTAVTLDIGFGSGESLLEMALARPSESFVGIEARLSNNVYYYFIRTPVHSSGWTTSGVRNRSPIREEAKFRENPSCSQTQPASKVELVYSPRTSITFIFSGCFNID